MEIDLAWLLVLPAVFALGWIVARYDRGQQRREAKKVPKDVLDGMSSLLGDDLAAATDSLLKAARLAPDSSDLHRAVGNLYRRRGMTDRAIEVHEIALRNPSLSQSERELMTLDLARDYLAAGIFDRAQETFELLASGSGAAAQSSSSGVAAQPSTHGAAAQSARSSLLYLFQRTRQWLRAIETLEAIKRAQEPLAEGQDYDQLMGHFCCELAELEIKNSNWVAALGFLEKARAYQAAGPLRRMEGLRSEIAARQNQTELASVGTVGAADQAYICKACGFRARKPLWQCPGCHRWDSFGALK